MIPVSKVEVVVRCCICNAAKPQSNGWFEINQVSAKVIQIAPMSDLTTELSDGSYVCSDACLGQIVQMYANEVRGAKTVHGAQNQQSKH